MICLSNDLFSKQQLSIMLLKQIQDRYIYTLEKKKANSSIMAPFDVLCVLCLNSSMGSGAVAQCKLPYAALRCRIGTGSSLSC